MKLIEKESTEKCPNCNCTYIIIDNELVFCPRCALSIIEDVLVIYEEEDSGKDLVQN
ncbi:MAG: hypothetical protein ACFFDY_06750 [Candidatus Thorarchaeota archaeon]